MNAVKRSVGVKLFVVAIDPDGDFAVIHQARMATGAMADDLSAGKAASVVENQFVMIGEQLVAGSIQATVPIKTCRIEFSDKNQERLISVSIGSRPSISALVDF